MYHIGQKVTWKVGNHNMVGCVLNDEGGESLDVVSHTRMGVPHVQQMKVEREILTKI